MEWEYEIYGNFDPTVTTTKLRITRDTIFDNKNCLILESESHSCTMRPMKDIIYQNGDKIYFYHEDDADFQLLYDFGAELGDVIKIRRWDWYARFLDYSTLRVDSISQIEYSGKNRRRFMLNIGIEIDGEIEYRDRFYEVIEGIGCTRNLFYFVDTGICDDIHVRDLRCFCHPNFGAYNHKLTCSITCSPLQVDLIPDFSIYPNPTSAFINIPSEYKYESFEIYDRGGTLVQKANYCPYIDVNDLSDGAYFIRFLNSDNYIVKSFIKVSDN